MASRERATIEVDRRFCGPPQSGNGGYVAGRLAAHVKTTPGEPAVAVRLFAPPPLETSLVVREEGEGASLFATGTSEVDGEDIKVAAARPVALDLTPPPPPTYKEAVSAAKAFRGFDEHVFPGCFVCGPDRAEGDGLRIFPGTTGRDDVFAAPWVPDVSLAHPGSSRVAPEFLWAALDCPGAFSFPQPEGKVILLGEMKVELAGEVEALEPCVLSSWVIRHDGRKHFTGSAIYNSSGQICGAAQGLWIEIEPDAVPRS